MINFVRNGLMFKDLDQVRLLAPAIRLIFCSVPLITARCL